MTHSEWIQGLRDLADFMETHPEIGTPSCTTMVHCWPDAPNIKERMAEIARIPGGWIKDVDQSENYASYRLERKFGSMLLSVTAWRDEVCERVQVGTKIQEARPQTVLPATPEKEVPVYEWHCSPLLAPEEEPTTV